MRVVAIKNPKSDAEHRLIHEMQRLRARIFRGRLAWAVRRTSGLEIVRFDTLRPTYVFCLDRSGSVIGCARFLPPTGGTMLEKVFPQLLEAEQLPMHHRMIETSRFCEDNERSRRTGAGGPPFGNTRNVCRHRRVEHPQWVQGNRNSNGSQARAHPASSRLPSQPARCTCPDQRNEKRRRSATRRLGELRSSLPQHLCASIKSREDL